MSMHVSVSASSDCECACTWGAGLKLSSAESIPAQRVSTCIRLIYCLFDLQAEYFMKFSCVQWEIAKNYLQVAQ